MNEDENMTWMKPAFDDGRYEKNEMEQTTCKGGIYILSLVDLERSKYNCDIHSQHVQCECTYIAHFHTQFERKQINLPQPNNQDKDSTMEFRNYKKKKYFTFNDVGILVYLPSNTFIYVKNHTLCQHCKQQQLQQQQSNRHYWKLDLKHSISIHASNDLSKIDIWAKSYTKKPIVCLHCYKPFSSFDTLNDHVRTNHTISPLSILNPLTYVYEDNDMAVIIKPQGVSVMGENDSLMKSDLLLSKKKENDSSFVSTKGQKPKAKPVHRLDSATGGLLVLAKTKQSECQLKKSFAKHDQCKKTYRAIVIGRLEVFQKNNSLQNIKEEYDCGDWCTDSCFDAGICDYEVDGKKAITIYKVVSYTRSAYPRANGWMTTLDIKIVTGRKHQIRKHMKLLGYPIWGDTRYGGYSPHELIKFGNDTKKRLEFIHHCTVQQYPHGRLCLWALQLTIPHPVHDSKVVSLSIDEPKWFNDLRIHEEFKYHDI